jgi:hypothetical protein
MKFQTFILLSSLCLAVLNSPAKSGNSMNFVQNQTGNQTSTPTIDNLLPTMDIMGQLSSTLEDIANVVTDMGGYVPMTPMNMDQMSDLASNLMKALKLMLLDQPVALDSNATNINYPFNETKTLE